MGLVIPSDIDQAYATQYFGEVNHLFDVANTVTRTAWHLTGTNADERTNNQ